MPRRALTPRTARRSAWWFVAVFVLGLLAPGVSAALAHVGGSGAAWQDVCTTRTARAADARPIEKALDLLAHGHCPACHIAHADVAGPPAATAPRLRDDLVAQAPERFWRAPATGHAWRPASARAPPALI